MAEPFFSIVMPVYRVEAHLEKAVRSVLEQTFPDFELILVDDGSPDGSGRIADKLAAEDGRVRVIHKEKNEGLSQARNTGLEQVRGRYVQFMDSDDWVEPALLAQVKASLDNHPAQVAVFGLIEEYYDAAGQVRRRVTVRADEEKRLETAAALRPEVIGLEKRGLYGYAWNKFYDAAYLRERSLQFEDVTLIEDILFNVQVFMDIERLNILTCTPYHYNKRLDESLTNRFVADYFELHEKRVSLILEQYAYWGMRTDGVRTALAGLYVRFLFSALQRNCDKRAGMTRRDRRRFLKRTMESALFKELAPLARGDHWTTACMCGLVRRRRIGLCLAAGRLLYIAKTKCPLFFAKAKQHR